MPQPREHTPKPCAPSLKLAIRIVYTRAEQAGALQKKNAKQVMHQLRQIYNLNLRTGKMALQLQCDVQLMQIKQQRPQNHSHRV